MFAGAKGKKQKYFRRLRCLEQCIDHIPYGRNSRKRPLRKFEKMVVIRAGRLRVLQKLINKEKTKEINV